MGQKEESLPAHAGANNLLNHGIEISRVRLNNAISELLWKSDGDRTRILLVTGPLGIGKTSLLRTWAHSVQTNLGAEVSWHQDVPANAWDAPLDRHLVPVVSIFDNVHELSAQDQLRLKRSIEAAGTSHRFILIGRRDPKFLPVSWSASGMVRRLPSHMLALTEEELPQYFREKPDVLKRIGEELLFTRTGGWCVCVRLAELASEETLGSAGEAINGAYPLFARYFQEELFSGLGSVLRQQLLRTAVVTEFDGSLAQALCEEDVGELMEKLDAGEIPLVASMRSGQYRYHPLWSEFLLHSAGFEQKERSRLLGIAADWYALHSEPELALTYALKALQSERIGALVNDSGLGLIMAGKAALVRAAIQMVPDPMQTLRVKVVAAAATAELEELKSSFHNLTSSTDVLSLDDQALLAGVKVAAAPRTETAIEALSQLELIVRAPIDSVEVHSYAVLQAARAALQAGRLSEAENWAQQGLNEARDGERHALRLQLLTVLLCTDTFQTRYDRTEKLSDEIRNEWLLIGSTPDRDFCLSRLLYAASFWYRGDASRALQVSQEAVDLLGMSELHFHWQAALGCTTLYSVDLAADRRLAILRTVEMLDPGPEIEFPPAALSTYAHTLIQWLVGIREFRRAYRYIASLPDSPAIVPTAALGRARLAISMGDINGARQWVARARNLSDGDDVITRVHRRLIDVEIALASNNRPAARSCLDSALELAAGQRLVRPFIDAPASIRPLLAQLTGHSTDSFAAQVFSFSSTPKQLGSSGLTEREREILPLLDSLLTLEEIANQLYVSTNTVKTHVARIYRKLGASKRRDAVRTARNLGLVGVQPEAPLGTR